MATIIFLNRRLITNLTQICFLLHIFRVSTADEVLFISPNPPWNYIKGERESVNTITESHDSAQKSILTNSPVSIQYGAPLPFKPQKSSFTFVNVTSNDVMLGSLEVPYGERTTTVFTFPSISEHSFQKYGEYDEKRRPKFGHREEPSINFGSIVTDTFTLKERKDARNPPKVAPTIDSGEILDGILKDVLAKSKRRRIPGGRTEVEGLHFPGDLILREIPINGKVDNTGLHNLTEFLLNETSRIPAGDRGNSFLVRERAPMFVAVQFHSLGRLKSGDYDNGAEKNTAIHVVLGDKHFQFKNVNELHQLYDYVRSDSYDYKPPPPAYYDSSNNLYYGPPQQQNPQPAPDYGVPDYAPKFSINSVIVDLIIEFIEFAWKTHSDSHEATRVIGKNIFNRLAKLLSRNSNRNDGGPQFRPYQRVETLQPDFFTWPYTNTLAFRTLRVTQNPSA